MKIVHATSELFPYAKIGGLADMVGSLATELAGNGHDVSVFMPGYRAVFEHPDTTLATRLFKLENGMGDAWVFSPLTNLTVFLLCNKDFFDRDGIYGTDGRDFEDNQHRFMFFLNGIIEVMRLLDMYVDVVHCHDWQTAMLPMLLRYNEFRYDVTLAKRTVLTIHMNDNVGKKTVQLSHSKRGNDGLHEKMPGDIRCRRNWNRRYTSNGQNHPASE